MVRLKKNGGTLKRRWFPRTSAISSSTSSNSGQPRGEFPVVSCWPGSGWPAVNTPPGRLAMQGNEHNAWIPRDFWLEDWEKTGHHRLLPSASLEGYRRITFHDAGCRRSRRLTGLRLSVLKPAGRGKPGSRPRPKRGPFSPARGRRINMACGYCLPQCQRTFCFPVLDLGRL